jgi:NADPH:quinone reductase
VMRFVEQELPAPGEADVLVEVEAIGVNFADVMLRRGEYLRNQPLSMGPGQEVVGRVVQSGASARELVGRRVAAWVEACGAYTTHAIVPRHRVYEVPEDLDAAAIVSVFFQGVTAYYALHRFGALAAGETVLVHAAAGGVGGLATQLAVQAGARVIGTTSSAGKQQAVLDAGAASVINSREVDLTEAVLAHTGGRGCDIVVDGVGGPLFLPSLRALAVRGRYVMVGAAAQQEATFDARRLLVRNQTVVGFILALITEADPAEPATALTHLCDLVRSSELRPSYRVLPFSLESAIDVHQQIEANAYTGKLVLVPNG